MSIPMIRIDRINALKEASAILLRIQRDTFPAAVIDSHAAVAQAWATVASALGNDVIELEPTTIGEVRWH